ncbi:hypothetical protein GALMADRAFT_280292 [Galerina marginata CBS 339.88]|uniref:Uncharacterized protein n=1 Tax=Galerina marginata (strain CBS 339.88) TaxID=685588 RepID=A0A067SW21_GALM3|nr:hypothetical protein GALMADRAFT_280292 [Galerina marginata CBS 339.88]
MVVYASFFNGTTTLETALHMPATDIIKKFDNFVNKADLYAVQEEARDYMKPAVSAIEAIYNRYKTEPEQHPGYIEDSSSLLSRLSVPYQSNKFDLRTLYDIVAWILSVVGPVPSIATRDNYYYPLMMIGYVFCAKLIPARKVTKKLNPGPPEVWSVMWFEQIINKLPVKRVVVGANLDKPGKSTKDDAKEFRKALLDASNILDWSQKHSVMQLRRGLTSQDFGHCAETYPLLFICSLGHAGQEATTIQRSVEGLAAKAPLLYTKTTAKIALYEEAKGVKHALMNPCLNCEWLLGYGEGFQISHFILKEREY